MAVETGGFADGGEDFGLFDGVDAQVGFKVEVDPTERDLFDVTLPLHR